MGTHSFPLRGLLDSARVRSLSRIGPHAHSSVLISGGIWIKASLQEPCASVCLDAVIVNSATGFMSETRTPLLDERWYDSVVRKGYIGSTCDSFVTIDDPAAPYVDDATNTCYVSQSGTTNATAIPPSNAQRMCCCVDIEGNDNDSLQAAMESQCVLESRSPTSSPTISLAPSAAPSPSPSAAPSPSPSAAPSPAPFAAPSAAPSQSPSQAPSNAPSIGAAPAMDARRLVVLVLVVAVFVV